MESIHIKRRYIHYGMAVVMLFFGNCFAFVSGEIDGPAELLLVDVNSPFSLFYNKAEQFKKEVARYMHGSESTEEFTAYREAAPLDPIVRSELYERARQLKVEAEEILNESAEYNAEQEKEYINQFLMFIQKELGVPL